MALVRRVVDSSGVLRPVHEVDTVLGSVAAEVERRQAARQAAEDASAAARQATAVDAVLRAVFEAAGVRPARSTRSGRQEDPLYEGLPEPKAPRGSMYRIWGS